MRGPANAAEENDPLVQGQLRSDLTPGDRAEEASIKERAKSSTPRNSETNALHKARGTFIAAFVTTVCCTALIVGVLFHALSSCSDHSVHLATASAEPRDEADPRDHTAFFFPVW